MKQQIWIKRLLSLIALAFALGGCGNGGEKASFSKDIQPLIAKYCLECHVVGGRGYRRTGLLLDSYEHLMEGHIVEPGEPLKSKMVLYVQPNPDPSMQMPYGDRPKLTKAEIALITDWVQQGARNN